MNDRLSVRNLKNRIARHVRNTPIFRDHLCQIASNTFSCPICALHERINIYPLAVLSVLRHFHFFNEAYLPEESDLFDLLGPEKVNRMIEEEQRRLFGSVKVKCKKCSHEMGFFDTYQENLRRSSGTRFVFKCTKCKTNNDILLFKEKDRIKIKKSRHTRKQRNLAHEYNVIQPEDMPVARTRAFRINPLPAQPEVADAPPLQNVGPNLPFNTTDTIITTTRIQPNITEGDDIINNGF